MKVIPHHRSFMPIRAVIFDYGMVLSNPADPVAHARMVAISGLAADALDRAYWRHRHEYDLGLTGPQFWDRVAADNGIRFTPEQIEQLIQTDIRMWTSVNQDMFAWVAALQNAGIRTAILSNMTAEIKDYMLQEFGWLAQFHHLTWSCELGIAKPDPAIYLHTCEKLGVRPKEALFLDDKPENVAAADAAGLHGIRFATVEQLRHDLESSGLGRELPVPGATVQPAS